VPDDHVVGEVGFGFYTAMKFLNSGRAYIGAICLGMAQFCLDYAIEHANTRTAFGKPISRNQAVSFPLADSKVEIEAARWLTYNLAWTVDENPESPTLMLDSSIVKLYGTEMVGRVADRAIQVLGGQGLMREVPIERIWRFARILRVVEGASEIQRLVIARSLGL
jgi:alkylation response protein AidB-like acyl-CoA dehydrogenase